MDETLLAEALDRLDDDNSATDSTKDLVLAALLNELESMLDGETPQRPKVGERQQATPVRAYVQSISVEGFRGVGPQVELRLPTGPGLTLIIGRNGSGKSSFAEALEYVLTGDNRRWSARRSKQWRAGWRNLHRPNPASIEAELLIDGESDPVTAQCTWAEGADLDDSRTLLRRKGKTGDLATLGWEQPLASYRPFLSYSELGGMLEEGPAKLFDALEAILGLKDLSEAAQRLAAKRLAITAEEKDVKQESKRICELLETLDDERANACLQAMQARRWDLEAVGKIIEGDQAGLPEDSAVQTLRELSTFPTPEIEAAKRAIAALREATAQVDRTAGTSAARARRLAAVLEKALDLHAKHGDDDCPVCSAPSQLNEAWAARAHSEVATLNEQAREVTEAQRGFEAAEGAARALATAPPSLLDRATDFDIAVDALREAWAALREVSAQDPSGLAERLEESVQLVASEAEIVRLAARTELEQREDAWRVPANLIRSWFPRAERIQLLSSLVKELRAAEKWIKDTTAAIREERFAPIGDRVKRFWELLRASSSVEIDDIALAGTATRRHVSLDVSVDGTPGVALGVMSQGELHALALSLFLPRATLEASPFGFVVIDDPVQAMDPARVDGLAQVLRNVASERQVVVLTHDDRLPEAVRRLRIPASVIEVQRRAGSVVELRRRKGPVEDAIDDALALAHTDDLPADAAARVIPGLCRQALEAACMDVTRRRRLARGQPHAEVETLLIDHPRLAQRLALALRDDATEEQETMGTLGNKYGKWAVDLVGDCNRGVHGQRLDDPTVFVRQTEKLAQELLKLP